MFIFNKVINGYQISEKELENMVGKEIEILISKQNYKLIISSFVKSKNGFTIKFKQTEDNSFPISMYFVNSNKYWKAYFQNKVSDIVTNIRYKLCPQVA